MTITRGMGALAASTLGICTLVGLSHQATGQQTPVGMPTISKAVAILTPTKGSHVEGRVTFTQQGRTIHVHAEIHGLTPGEHGFHIHEYGVWSEDGMAAGGHFNPTMSPHAGPHTKTRHIGDLGNITANEKGVAILDVDDPHLTFEGRLSIIGRGLVVHEKPDDLKTQPTGNAGGRVAVGVIGVAKP